MWKTILISVAAIPCPKVIAPEYGYVKVRGYGTGSKVVYYCQYGYKLYGDGHITCDYGLWKGTPPVCKRKNREETSIYCIKSKNAML